MADDPRQPPTDPKSSAFGSWKAKSIAAAGAVVLAILTAMASGFGSEVASELHGSSTGQPVKPLLSASAVEEVAGCGPSIFLPERAAHRLADRKSESDEFQSFQKNPGFAFADFGTVNVSIQGESRRTVTLTGISFKVTREKRPPGALFSDPCGGPTVGRTIVFDVDKSPPQITETNADVSMPLGSEEDGHALTKPIRFPWTVSLTDPLLLKLIAITKSRCYCSWTAEIPWVSGAKRGTIRVDNGGKGFKLVGSAGLRLYTPNFDRPGWIEQPPSAASAG